MMRADCVVVGAGPGGLTAAVYLARYLRDVIVLDDGRSRALWIARSHNCPGYPNGIPGPELLERLRRQAVRYGALLRQEPVEALQHAEDGSFVVRAGPRPSSRGLPSSRPVRRMCSHRFRISTAQSGVASCVTARPAMPMRFVTGG
jgi:glycine/D-amino acid oxidase-like deaminating enzyme